MLEKSISAKSLIPVEEITNDLSVIYAATVYSVDCGLQCAGDRWCERVWELLLCSDKPFNKKKKNTLGYKACRPQSIFTIFIV